MDKKEIKLTEKQAKIWNEIKDKPASYYALKNMTVGAICEPVNIDPDNLYVSLKGPASIVSIEEVLNADLVNNWAGKEVPKYIIEQRDRFAVIMENPEVKSPIKK